MATHVTEHDVRATQQNYSMYNVVLVVCIYVRGKHSYPQQNDGTWLQKGYAISRTLFERITMFNQEATRMLCACSLFASWSMA